MPTRVAAKSEILQRIRTANRGHALRTLEQDWLAIPRTFNRGPAASKQALFSLFIDRLRDYDADVTRTDAASIANTIGTVLADRKQPRMLVASGFPASCLPAGNLSFDEDFSAEKLDLFDGILTQSTLAIAETGTLVLQAVPGQGRRAATLVPDFHLCVLREADVVQSVPEAISLLASTSTLPTTFISGPSATADIEMTRIKGVHGPRFLHVVLVRDE